MQGEGVAAGGARRRRRRRACRALAAQPALPRAHRATTSRRPAPTDGQGRMRAAAEALAAAWAIAPPAHPVIVAGSTGSRGGDARASWRRWRGCRRGRWCCPGFDADLPAAVWERLGADDAGRGRPSAARLPPARRRARLRSRRRAAPGIRRAPPAPARNALVSLALRPAPVTDQWRGEGAALAGTLAGRLRRPRPGSRRRTRAARRGRSRSRCARRPRPARARRWSRPTATLARRVAAELDRWGLIPDDSAGRPLALTPPGVLLRRLAALPGAPLTPAGAARRSSSIRWSNERAGRAAARTCGLTARLETRQLRGGAPWIDWATSPRWAADGATRAPAWIALAARRAGAARPARRRAARRARRAPPRRRRGAGRPGRRAAAHGLWDKEAGAQARALLDALAAEAGGCGADRAPHDYRALLAVADGGARRAGGGGGHPPRHRDLGHARGAGAVGRPGGARRAQRGRLAAAAGRRPLARPRPCAAPSACRARSGGSASRRTTSSRRWARRAWCSPAPPATPRRRRCPRAGCCGSRTCSLGLGPEGAPRSARPRRRGAALLAPARRGSTGRPRRCRRRRRPAPRPPAAARPAELSVTQIETLVRDPYAIYAREGAAACARSIRPAARPDALARGSAIHAALDAFVTATEAGLPPDAAAVFRATVARGAGRGGALAGGARDLDRAARPRRRLVPRRRGRAAGARRARRRARSRAPRRRRAWRCPSRSPPRPTASTAPPDGGYAIYDYKSGGAPEPPRRRPSTCSCRSRRRSPRPAASRACPPGPARAPRADRVRHAARPWRSTPIPRRSRHLGRASPG